MGRVREERNREQKSDKRESDGAQRDGNRGRDEKMDGERRAWPRIRGTMGRVQPNQSRAELYSGLVPQ